MAKIQYQSNTVVIMAGGKGLRLRPLTKYCPKPMVKVAGKPILERIISRFVESGINNFYLSVNYLSDMVEDYFGDGKKFDCQIKYLKEKKYLHTGGSLSLIKEELSEPLIVMNGDIITNLNFKHLLQFHHTGHFKATMCVREYSYEVPFGVIEAKNDKMKSLIEKPTHTLLINAGIYVINPETIKLIPKNKVYPLTKLFDRLLKDKAKIGVYKMTEDWIDVGRIDDLKKAQEEMLLLEEQFVQEKKS